MTKPHHKPMLTINPSSPAIFYVMTATSKRLLISESHDDPNRCTPYRGKHDQHATRFSRSVRVWSTTIRISRGPHIATFCTVVNRFEQIHCTREEGLPTQSTARRLTDHSSIYRSLHLCLALANDLSLVIG
jgi:hypothetical protein